MVCGAFSFWLVGVCVRYVYFYDCPRTGGTSFKRWSRRVVGFKRVYYGGSVVWHHVPFRSRGEVSVLAPVGSSFFTFTLLRDPVEHTASLYSKIRVHVHGFRSKLEGLTFHEWVCGDFVEDRCRVPASWGFSMVRFYDPESGDLGRAIANVESMDFVGFTDRLGQDINEFMDVIGVSQRYDGSCYNKVCRDYVISLEDRKRILEVRADDLELVNYFRVRRGLSPYV